MIEFLGGTLPPEGRSAVERHVGTCTACADLLTWAAADQTNDTARLPGHEGRPFVGQLQPGARIGRYQILGAVGRGGMGEVYAAYHPDLDRRIALKVVQGFDGSTGERRARLLREARAIARLSHPNVVTVHDAGTFGDRVFIAMELIDGKTIDAWLRAAPRGWREIVDVFIAAGRGLAAAHAAGVIHRDFKPQNVMIGKDGTVRVMDFGLARLAEDEAGHAIERDGDDDVPTVSIGIVTKTGAFIGTPAYMSPEQFRREASDERSDQFSFCVALHEALFGTRPAAAFAGAVEIKTETSTRLRTSVPGWLRSIVLRGADPNREGRYSSMAPLLAALERGRTRTRRRLSLLAASAALLVLSTGGWRLARGSRFTCVIPRDRIAAAWPADAAAARRQSIHRAFATTGRATADTSWQRVSKVLDDYMTAWGTMYVQACEATHVRREQSVDILDLRMSCLDDNLDQVRALTDALMTANSEAVSHSVTAAMDLTPVERCADIPVLRSVVPLPKDEHTLRQVLAMKRVLRDVDALRDVGDVPGVLRKAIELRPQVREINHKPLMAQLMELTGWAHMNADRDPAEGATILRDTIVLSEECRDDITAATAAANLAYVLGYRMGRLEEAEFVFRLSMAMLDRIGRDSDRVRAWALYSYSALRAREGDFEGARAAAEQSIALKEKILRPGHPDIAAGLGGLSFILTQLAKPDAALSTANRAIRILLEHGDPDSYQLAWLYANQGDALNALSRYEEAERAFESSLRIFRGSWSPEHPETAYTLHGLAETKLAKGEAKVAVPLLEQVLDICDTDKCDPMLTADSRFALARALWMSGLERPKARALATSALKAFRESHRSTREDAVNSWLHSHPR